MQTSWRTSLATVVKTVLAILVATVIWRQTGNSQFCLLLSQCLGKTEINIKPLERGDPNAKKTYYILAADRTIHYRTEGLCLPYQQFSPFIYILSNTHTQVLIIRQWLNDRTLRITPIFFFFLLIFFKQKSIHLCIIYGGVFLTQLFCT